MLTYEKVKSIPQTVQDNIIKDYLSFIPYNKIASKYNITRKLVENVIMKNGVRKHGKQLKRLSNEETKEFIELYKSGIKVEDLCIKFDTTYYILKQVARENGLSLRKRGPISKLENKELAEKCIKHWKNGCSQIEIANEYKISQFLVSKLIRKYLSYEEYSKLNKYNRKITKGHIKHDAGYIMIRLNPNDKFFSMVNSSGYVMEHRYIMALHIGRSLLKTETVHHKDGNRANNNIDNLQLMVGNHGKNICYQCADCGSKNLKPAEI